MGVLGGGTWSMYGPEVTRAAQPFSTSFRYPGKMPDTPRLDRKDVVMFINSLKIVRTLPPDSQDRAIGSLRQGGYYVFWAGTYGYAGHGGATASALWDSGRYGGKPIVEHELTPEEEDAVRLALRLVHEKGKNLHLVDVGKESAFRRLVEEHLHHLRRFPSLIRHDGRRLEGVEEFTPEKLESFLAD
jgi:hypothetical protein